MARYIDADAFIEDIKTEIVNLAMDGLKGTPRASDELFDIIDRVGNQPTAYDVDKVVQELEEEVISLENNVGDEVLCVPIEIIKEIVKKQKPNFQN